LIVWLSKDNHHPDQSKHKKKQNICLDNVYHAKDLDNKLSKENIIPSRHKREERIFRRKHYTARRRVVKEQIHGIINLGNYLQGMKRS
jgi:hypothetical protein